MAPKPCDRPAGSGHQERALLVVLAFGMLAPIKFDDEA
jgi:hypothetical protein